MRIQIVYRSHFSSSVIKQVGSKNIGYRTRVHLVFIPLFLGLGQVSLKYESSLAIYSTYSTISGLNYNVAESYYEYCNKLY